MSRVRYAAITISLLGITSLFMIAYVSLGGPEPYNLVPVFGLALMAGLVTDSLRARLRTRDTASALANFLYARLDEEEQRARTFAYDEWLAIRLREDIVAKRQIVGVLVKEAHSLFDLLRGIATRGSGDRAVLFLRLLARPYADHHQFSPDWLEPASSQQ